jgi:hypothetical protein
MSGWQGQPERDDLGERNRSGTYDEECRPGQPKEREKQQPANRVQGQDVPIPDQKQMGRTQDEEPGHPSNQKAPGADLPGRSPFDLYRDAYAKQKRKDREGFEFQSAGDQQVHEVICPSRIGVGPQDMLQQWDPEHRQQVDHEYAEQRQTTEDVDRPIPLGWRCRRRSSAVRKVLEVLDRHGRKSYYNDFKSRRLVIYSFVPGGQKCKSRVTPVDC